MWAQFPLVHNFALDPCPKFRHTPFTDSGTRPTALGRKGQHKMTNQKYFADINGTTTELKMVYYDGRKAFGTPVDFTPVYDRAAQKWNRGGLAAFHCWTGSFAVCQP